MPDQINDGALLSLRVLHELVHADHESARSGGVTDGIYSLLLEGTDALTVVRSPATDPLADPVHLLTYHDPPSSRPKFLTDHGWRLDDLWVDHDDHAVQLLVDDPVRVLDDIAKWRREH